MSDGIAGSPAQDDRPEDQEPIEFDRWIWHTQGDFPGNRPAEQGYVHIGLFVAWLAGRDLLDESWLERAGAGQIVAAMKDRRQGCSGLRDVSDGSLSPDMLADEGRAFAMAYYLPEYGYARDYRGVFGDAADVYAVEDSWASYERLAPVLDRRYQEWVSAGRPTLIPMQTLLPSWLGFLRPKG